MAHKKGKNSNNKASENNYTVKNQAAPNTEFHAYCKHCFHERSVKKISVDWKGAWILELECGHIEAYEPKIIAMGQYVFENFGK